MLFQECFDNIINLIHVFTNKQVVVFGTGMGGKTVGAVLNSINIKDYYYVDNDNEKWGGELLGRQIYSPSQLLKEDRNGVIILVASIFWEEIATQLTGLGFVGEENFYSALNMKKDPPISQDFSLTVLEQVIMICRNSPNTDVLLLGDSVMSAISYHDINRQTFYEMVKRKIGLDYRVEGIHAGGLDFSIYYCILKTLSYLKKMPPVVIMPINMRYFSPNWYLNCDRQSRFDKVIEDFNIFLQSINVDGFVEINDVNKGVTYDEYISHCSIYWPHLLESNSKFISWVSRKPTMNQKEFCERYKQIYTWHYLYLLNEDNNKLVLLKKIIELFAENQKTQLFTYITPINHLAATNFVGPIFSQGFEENLKVVKNLFHSELQNVVFSDLSLLFSPQYFTHENDTTEHLNEKGRELLSNLISSVTNKILQKGI